MVVIGLDLAWSARNASGMAVVDATAAPARLHSLALLRDDTQILAAIRAAAAAPALIAVDAPLRVTNAGGSRPADAQLSADFRRYEAGVHSVNLGMPHFADGGRGARLMAALAADGFVEITSPDVVPARGVFECYPHAAIVSIFGLTRTLKYKARGAGRSRATRLAAWGQYHALLHTLAVADPPLLGVDAVLLPAATLVALSDAALKRYEDQIDALFCAYIALYLARWGAARCVVYGDATTGALITPRVGNESV